jgi:hypothetical protein
VTGLICDSCGYPIVEAAVRVVLSRPSPIGWDPHEPYAHADLHPGRCVERWTIEHSREAS